MHVCLGCLVRWPCKREACCAFVMSFLLSSDPSAGMRGGGQADQRQIALVFLFSLSRLILTFSHNCIDSSRLEKRIRLHGQTMRNLAIVSVDRPESYARHRSLKMDERSMPLLVLGHAYEESRRGQLCSFPRAACLYPERTALVILLHGGQWGSVFCKNYQSIFTRPLSSNVMRRHIRECKKTEQVIYRFFFGLGGHQ